MWINDCTIAYLQDISRKNVEIYEANLHTKHYNMYCLKETLDWK